jgi:hypothetical protein
VRNGGPAVGGTTNRTGTKRGDTPLGSKSSRVNQFIAELRAQNSQLDRISKRLRKVYATGERLSIESTLELARLCNAFDILDQLLARFSTADSELLALTGGDIFPPDPLHLVVGGRR